jgi:hypothetical protein
MSAQYPRTAQEQIDEDLRDLHAASGAPAIILRTAEEVDRLCTDRRPGALTPIPTPHWQFDLFSAAIGGLVTLGLFLAPIFVALCWGARP